MTHRTTPTHRIYPHTNSTETIVHLTTTYAQRKSHAGGVASKGSAGITQACFSFPRSLRPRPATPVLSFAPGASAFSTRAQGDGCICQLGFCAHALAKRSLPTTAIQCWPMPRARLHACAPPPRLKSSIGELKLTKARLENTLREPQTTCNEYIYPPPSDCVCVCLYVFDILAHLAMVQSGSERFSQFTRIGANTSCERLRATPPNAMSPNSRMGFCSPSVEQTNSLVKGCLLALNPSRPQRGAHGPQVLHTRDMLSKPPGRLADGCDPWQN